MYIIDPAFAQRLGFDFSENKGRILENIVYLELLRHGKEVYYHSGKKECDFLVKEGLNIVEAIQVAYQVNVNNLKREYQGLQEAMTTYNLKEGLLLNYNNEESFIPENVGMKVIPVWEWLLTA